MSYVDANNNQKMSGGCSRKQGLPRTVGLGPFSSNIIQRKAGYCKCIPANTNCNYLLYYSPIIPAPIPNKPFIVFSIGGSLTSLQTDINTVISNVQGSILFTGLSSYGSDCNSNYSIIPIVLPLFVNVRLTITQAGSGNITVVDGRGYKQPFVLFAGGYVIVSLSPVSQVGTGIYNTTDPITISVVPYP